MFCKNYIYYSKFFTISVFFSRVANPRQNSYVDRSVTISSNLSFEAHTNNLVFEATQRVGKLFTVFILVICCLCRRHYRLYVRLLNITALFTLAILDLELRRLWFGLEDYFEVFNHPTSSRPTDVYLICWPTPFASSRPHSPFLQKPGKVSNK